MNIVGIFLIIFGLYLVKLNSNKINDKENEKKNIPMKEINQKKDNIQNNVDINTIKEELFWKPSPWEHLHGYKVNIKDKRFY
jgi:hypothetical protein